MCSANAGRICQAGAQAFPSHRGTEATGACASLQIRGVKPGNCRTTADTGTAPATSWGGIWAGKAESLRLLSYTHWPQRSASYGRGDTLKVSHHTSPARHGEHKLLCLHTSRFSCDKTKGCAHLPRKLSFTFFHIFMQCCEQASWKNR